MSIYHLTDGSPDINSRDFHLDRDDPSLNSKRAAAFEYEYAVDAITLNDLFLSRCDLEYVSLLSLENQTPVRILSLPEETNTCYEKVEILKNWSPLDVIKALYFESCIDGGLYAVVVPETGCFLDRENVRNQLNMDVNETISKATCLPSRMSFGTCSPFIRDGDLFKNGGRVKYIVFDKNTLLSKKNENSMDDFSFGIDHRLSIQMNYYHCYKILRSLFPSVVIDRDVLRLSFTERLVRKKGRIKIDYEFKTLNYRTARFIDDIHGHGDVSIVNDHVDELFIPDVLTSQNGSANETP